MKIKKYLDKYKNMSPMAKSSLALVFAKFFQKGIAMLSSPIFTRIMPQEQYGIVSTFISWQTVIYIIATLNMAQGVFNNGMLDFKDKRDSFTCSILVFANVCTLGLATIYMIFYRWLAPIIDMPDSLMILLFAYCLFTPAYNYWLSRQRFEYKYKAITALMISSSIISTVASIILVLYVSDEYKAVAKLIGSEAIMIGIAFIFCVASWKNVRKGFNLYYCKYAAKYNLPLIPHYLSMYVLSSSDRIMITKFDGAAQTAIYNVAYTVASILLILWNSVDASYAPWIYQKMEDKDYKAIAKRGNQVLVMFLGATLLSIMFAPEIMEFLAPDSYLEGVYIIPIVAAGVYFTVVYSLYMRIELYLKKMHTVTIGTVCAAILNIVLNVVFIPMFGYQAAGYTTLICYALLSLFHYLNVKRLRYAQVYNNKFVLQMSLVMLVVIAIALMIYQYTIVRYVCIVVVLVLLYIKREEVIQLIKSNKR